MPTAVTRQRGILAAMLQVVELEPALRWFELGCSLGRHAGDELSDIDCAVGVADDEWAHALDLATRLATAGGSVSDTMRQRCANGPRSAGSPSVTLRNTSIAVRYGRPTRACKRRAARSSSCGLRAADA